ncbi:MAG: glycosyltransferase family 1 protein [bacterium]|nr:glycosyltransferase family 1 protein [bacterium]
MRIAIDASRAAGEQKTGIGWYTHHLLAHMRTTMPDGVGVRLYSDAVLPSSLGPITDRWEQTMLPWPPLPAALRAWFATVGLPLRWPLWSQLRLAERVIRDASDVLFVPAHVIPFVLMMMPRVKRPQLVTTIHDVVFCTFPETYSMRERWYADHATRLAVRSGAHIIVPTQHVADELMRYYAADPAHITVIYHGVSHVPPPPAGRGGEGGWGMAPSILYVGRLEHKKNVVRIVEAFTRVAKTHANARLVLAGSDGYGADAVRRAIAASSVADRIDTPGWVDPARYAELLRRASVFCFPTLAEGFGLPILEAMAAGIPVVTSRGGAHEEVAGEAALLVDPQDPAAIADALTRVLDDTSLARSLAVRGTARARLFSWDKTASKTWKVLCDIMKMS